MAIDTQPNSPGWWLNRLIEKLRTDLPRYNNLNSYYEGTNGIPVYADEACKDAFRRLSRIACTNWAALSVEAALERLRPVGFKTGAADDRLGDSVAWEIYQTSGLDLAAPQTFEAAMAMSASAMIVGIPQSGELPRITPEDPREVAWETDPTDRRRVLAALKVYRDDVAGVDRAFIYLPGKVHRFVADVGSPSVTPRQKQSLSPLYTILDSWEEDGDPVTVPGGRQLFVPFLCEPKMDGTGRGSFEKHLPLLDRANYLMLNQLEVVTLQAFRQRALMVDDDEMATVDEDGNPIDLNELLEQGPGAVWKLPASAKMWESGAVDVAGLVTVCREPVKDFAAVSGTPLFYLTPESSDGSAEGASLARERLLFRTSRYMTQFEDSLERVMATAFAVMGDEERAQLPAMQVLWEAPERWTLAQMADADMKAAKGGALSLRKRRELIYKMTPQEIEDMEADDVRDALRAQGASLVNEAVNGTNTGGGQPALGPDEG